MATRPSDYPMWADIYNGDQFDELGNPVESRSTPPIEIKNDGLLPDEPMPRQWLNHQFWLINEWIEFADENGGTTAFVYQGDATLAEMNALVLDATTQNYAYSMTEAGDITNPSDEGVTLPVIIGDVVVVYVDTIHGGQGLSNMGAIKGVKGDKGEQGEVGDAPAHTWVDTSLMFENPDGSDGTLVELKGERGDIGTGTQLIGTDTVNNILAKTDATVGDMWTTADNGYFPPEHPVTPNALIDANNGLVWTEEGYWAYVSYGAITYGVIIKGAEEVAVILANTTADVGDMWIALDDDFLPPDHPVSPNRPVLAGDGLIWTESDYWAWADLGLSFDGGDVRFNGNLVISQGKSLLGENSVDGSLSNLVTLDAEDDISVGAWSNSDQLATKRVGIFAVDSEAWIVEELGNPARQYQVLSTKNGVTLGTAQTITGAKVFSAPVNCSTAPVAVGDLTRKDYVDNANVAQDATIALKETIVNVDSKDATTLASANAYADTSLVSAKAYTDSTNATQDAVIVLKETIVNVDSKDATTLASANSYTDSTNATQDATIALKETIVNVDSKDATTLASANSHTDSTNATQDATIALKDTITSVDAKDATTLASANTYTDGLVGAIPPVDLSPYDTIVNVDAKDATTLSSANSFTTSSLVSTTPATFGYTGGLITGVPL